MKETAIACVTSAGRILLEDFGRVRDIRLKDDRSSIVTETDLASEKHILSLIRGHHPDHNIVAEESGYQDRGSAFTWVVDPLDGTSNFAVGLPWFGVMVAVLEQNVPVLAAMYLPVDDALYFAEDGQGASRNGKPVRVTSEPWLSHVLCAYGMDATADDRRAQQQASLLGRLVQQVRNIRATNSLVDFTMTIEGRLGACINFNTKIWDIAAPSLMLQEAGGVLTDLRGAAIRLSLDADCCSRSYAVMGANPTLLRQLLAVMSANEAVSP